MAQKSIESLENNDDNVDRLGKLGEKLNGAHLNEAIWICRACFSMVSNDNVVLRLSIDKGDGDGDFKIPFCSEKCAKKAGM